jgi:DNA-binding XRE family transcriptional regulator
VRLFFLRIALEADKYTPSPELAFRIANVFEAPIGEVFECKIEDANL